MAYRKECHLEPLRIRAWLRSGVDADNYLPLDGILLYQVYRRELGPQVVTTPGAYPNDMNSVTLPLGVIHPNKDNWYYQCSWAQWSHEAEGKSYWNKRFDSSLADLVDFGKRRGKVLVEQGDHKAYHMPVFYRVSKWVEWYCVGDASEIKSLLSTATNIGKKPAQGWGRVSQWDVEPWRDDWSVWNGDKLMRGIPKDDAPTGLPYNIGNYGIRPSYWYRDNQRMLVMPV